jgi:hypothetical protein
MNNNTVGSSSYDEPQFFRDLETIEQTFSPENDCGEIFKRVLDYYMWKIDHLDAQKIATLSLVKRKVYQVNPKHPLIGNFVRFAHVRFYELFKLCFKQDPSNKSILNTEVVKHIVDISDQDIVVSLATKCFQEAQNKVDLAKNFKIFAIADEKTCIELFKKYAYREPDFIDFLNEFNITSEPTRLDLIKKQAKHHPKKIVSCIEKLQIIEEK